MLTIVATALIFFRLLACFFSCCFELLEHPLADRRPQLETGHCLWMKAGTLDAEGDAVRRRKRRGFFWLVIDEKSVDGQVASPESTGVEITIDWQCRRILAGKLIRLIPACNLFQWQRCVVDGSLRLDPEEKTSKLQSSQLMDLQSTAIEFAVCRLIRVVKWNEFKLRAMRRCRPTQRPHLATAAALEICPVCKREDGVGAL